MWYKGRLDSNFSSIRYDILVIYQETEHLDKTKVMIKIRDHTNKIMIKRHSLILLAWQIQIMLSLAVTCRRYKKKILEVVGRKVNHQEKTQTLEFFENNKMQVFRWDKTAKMFFKAVSMMRNFKKVSERKH